MTRIAISRRHLLAAGAGAVATAYTAQAATKAAPATPAPGAGSGGDLSNQELIRKWYGLWEKTDWAPVDAMLTDDFTFSSAAGDDHISKSTFKKQCWETQLGFIGRFELEQVFGSGNEALVKYHCWTKNGKSFRNVEYLRFKGQKIEAIECYFGEQSSFPSAMSSGKKG